MPDGKSLDRGQILSRVFWIEMTVYIDNIGWFVLYRFYFIMWVWVGGLKVF